MTQYILTLTATAQGYIANNLATIYTFIDNNPGTTRTLVASGLSINQGIVDYVIDKVLFPSNIIVRGHNVAGTEFIWTGGDWAAALIANIAAARTWLTTHDNGLVSLMATNLSIHEAVAIALAFALQWELKAQLTAQ